MTTLSQTSSAQWDLNVKIIASQTCSSQSYTTHQNETKLNSTLFSFFLQNFRQYFIWILCLIENFLLRVKLVECMGRTETGGRMAQAWMLAPGSTPTFQGYEMTFTGWWCSTAPACSTPAQLPVGAHTVNIHNTPSHPSHWFQVTHQYSTFTGASVNLASVKFSSSKKEM